MDGHLPARLFCFNYLFNLGFVTITGWEFDDIRSDLVGGSDLLVALRNAGLVVVLVLGIILPHEYIHGFFMNRYGGSLAYGVGIGFFVGCQVVPTSELFIAWIDVQPGIGASFQLGFPTISATAVGF